MCGIGLLLFLAQVFDVVNEGGKKIPKNVSGYESRWLSAIFSKESVVVL